MGAQNEIEGNDVQPNQKNATANKGAPGKANSNRYSGGTACGLNFSINLSYRGLK